MKNWSQFYTPKNLANILVNSIDKSFSPLNIIDICAGSCNLLNSAYAKWPNANFYASDLEPINTKLYQNINIQELNAMNVPKIVHLYKSKRRKLVLANPPFGEFIQLDKIIYSKTLKEISESIKGVNRIECLITLSNLSILNRGDYFAAILPENVFTGDRLEGFRNSLFNLFSNLKIKNHIIRFGKSEVNTRILSGLFTGNQRQFHEIPLPQVKINVNSKKSFQILRGIDNSLLKDEPVNKYNIKVLHFNNKNGNIEKVKTIAYSPKYDKFVVEKNDILIFRVGRNAGKIIYPDKRHIGFPPSDLLMILKNAKELGKTRLDDFEQRLKANAKGLSSKYVSKKDVLHALNS